MPETYSEFNDTLTGSFSRQVFHQRFPEEIMRSLRYSSPLTLMVLDIDHFKSINDAFGHGRGDEVLAEFIGLLKKQIRFTDLVFRYGGDEFVVLMLETSREAAVPVAGRLLESVREHVFRGDPDISITLSIGLAECPLEATDSRGLFEKADSRLLEAKFAGRNRMVADDTFRDIVLPFDEISRLIERESAMRTVRDFLDQIVERKRGFLSIKGLQGSGISRMITESVKASRIMNFSVMSLKGNSLLRGYPFNALVSVDEPPWNERLQGADSVDAYVERIGAALTGDPHERGFIITADAFGNLDRATREVIYRLLNDPSLPVVGIISGDDTDSLARMQCQGNPIRDMIELEPLTPDGLKIWLRSLLQWDPPARFTGWIMRATQGLPAYVKRALLYLVKREILQKTRDGAWALKPHYQDIPLGQRIGLDIAPPPCNLPKDLHRFVGRKEEIRTITELLDHHRLVTILGPGGIGKTRLAIQTASEKHPAFEHGTFFIALAQMTSSEQVYSSMADIIGLQFHGSASMEKQLIEYLRPKELLLIMDNTETVQNAPDIIADILTECPDVRMLCTSRERLNIHGETVFSITGLSFPDRSDDPRIHEYSALKLFEQTAQNADPAFTIDRDNTDDIIRICSLIHGIPLGIILAAPWVRILSCGEIADEIEKSMDFLVSEQPNICDRHRSLRAVFEYSWNALSPDEQRIFSQLSVFRDGFSRQAAEHVAGVALHHLSSLMDKSLLYRMKPARYFILEVLRQLADEKLDIEPDRKRSVQMAHCEFYANLAKKLRREVADHHEKATIEKMTHELKNLIEGWLYAATQHHYHLVSDYLSSLYYYYEFSGLYEEGESILARPLQHLTDHSETDPDRERRRQEVLADCFDRCGSLSFYNGKFDRAKDYYQRSLELFQSTGMISSAAMALNGLGMVAMRCSDYATARRMLDQAVSMIPENDDTRSRMIILNNLANVAYSQGEYDVARRSYEESLRIARSVNDRRSEAGALANLALVYGDMGEILTKKKYLEDSLEIRKQLDDRSTSTSALDSLANVEFFLGNYSVAEQLHQDSLDLRKEVGDQWGITISLINIAVEKILLKKYPEADVLLDDCIRRCGQLGARAEMAFALACRGHLKNLTGLGDEAWNILDSSMSLATEINFRYGMAWAKTNMGYVAHEQQDPERSIRHFREALEIAFELGMIPMVEEIIAALADVLAEGNRPARQLAFYMLNHLKLIFDSCRQQLKIESSKIKGLR